MLISGNRPVLVVKVYWSDGPNADGINASFDRYGIPEKTQIQVERTAAPTAETVTAISDEEPYL